MRVIKGRGIRNYRILELRRVVEMMGIVLVGNDDVEILKGNMFFLNYS